MLRLIWAELKKVLLNTKFMIAIAVTMVLSLILFGACYSGVAQNDYSYSDVIDNKYGNSYRPVNSAEYIAEVVQSLENNNQTIDNKLEQMKSLMELDAKQLVKDGLEVLKGYNEEFVEAFSTETIKPYIDYVREDLASYRYDDLSSYPEMFDTDGKLKEKYLPLLDKDTEVGEYISDLLDSLTKLGHQIDLMEGYNSYIFYHKDYSVRSLTNMLLGDLYIFGKPNQSLEDIEVLYGNHLTMLADGETDEEMLAHSAREINERLRQLIIGHEEFSRNQNNSGNKGILNSSGYTWLTQALEKAIGHKITDKDYAKIENVIRVKLTVRLNQIIARLKSNYTDSDILSKEQFVDVSKEAGRYINLIFNAQNYADTYAKYSAIKSHKDKSFANYSYELEESEYTYKSIITSYEYALDNGYYIEGYVLGVPKVEGFARPSAPMSFAGIIDWMIFDMISPARDENMYGFISFMMVFLSLIIVTVCVIIGGGLIAGEQQRGTIKMLIIRPYKRWKILTAKLLSTLIIGVALTLVSIIMLIIIGAVFFGYSLVSLPVFGLFNASAVVIMPAFVELLVKTGFFIINLVIYVLISTLFSVIMKSRTAAVVVTLLLNIVGTFLILAFMNWWPMRLLIFANSDLYLFFGRGVLDGSVFFGFSAFMCILYVLVFAGLAYYFFSKRDLN